VLRKAGADAMAWPAQIKVAVNLSAVQFKKCNLLDVVLRALEASGLPAGRLELEITETVMLKSEVNLLDMIRQLKNLGVSIALDDFGTGYFHAELFGDVSDRQDQDRQVVHPRPDATQ
jgi:EAL domain-containing protein (putative c-di-GMP-specific phosphodiesterase class I)